MTAAEKAKQLLQRFDLPTGLMSVERKQCALICVDEYLKFHESLFVTEDSLVHKYWTDVKNEIEKQ